MLKVDWSRVAKLLKDVHASVDALIGSSPPDLLPIRIKERLEFARPSTLDEPVGWLLDAAAKMLSVQTPDDLRRSSIEPMLVDGQFPADRFDEVTTDVLTGVWLGLYFLGVPFNAPWERAVQIAESGGGFPHGACVNKAIGDVYRSARRIYLSDCWADVVNLRTAEKEWIAASHDTAASAGGKLLVAPPRIVVFTRRPLALLQVDSDRPTTRCIPELTWLGRYYAQVQLSLYTLMNLPITYLVSRNAIEEIFSSQDMDLDRLVASATRVLGTASGSCQSIVVTDEKTGLQGIPTCVLGHNRGIYTLTDSEMSRAQVPFAGNRFGSEMTAAYRSKLAGAAGTRITWSDPTEFAAKLKAAVTAP